jgi:hypothetical protein
MKSLESTILWVVQSIAGIACGMCAAETMRLLERKGHLL